MQHRRKRLNFTCAPSPDRPLPPRNITVPNIKSEACFLHWDAPLDDGGSDLTNYIVEKKEVVTEAPELEEGQEAPPEPQWEVVTNSIIERKFWVRSYSADLSILHKRYGIEGGE